MIRLVTLLVLVGVLSLPAHAKESRETVQDTSSSSMSFFEIISWPFIHVIQPFFVLCHMDEDHGDKKHSLVP